MNESMFVVRLDSETWYEWNRQFRDGPNETSKRVQKAIEAMHLAASAYGLTFGGCVPVEPVLGLTTARVKP